MIRQFVVLGVLLASPSAVWAQDQVFKDAQLTLQVDGKTESVDVRVRFDADSFDVLDNKTGTALKSFPYAAITSAEYSYGKSPRWKTAIFVSPLFLFTSGKKHWVLTHGPGDFAMLRLDKSNYKLVLATLETKTGKPVELNGDNK